MNRLEKLKNELLSSEGSYFSEEIEEVNTLLKNNESYQYYLNESEKCFKEIDNANFSLNCMVESLSFQLDIINSLSFLSNKSNSMEDLFIYKSILKDNGIKSYEDIKEKMGAVKNKISSVLKSAFSKLRMAFSNILAGFKRFFSKFGNIGKKVKTIKKLLNIKKVASKTFNAIAASAQDFIKNPDKIVPTLMKINAILPEASASVKKTIELIKNGKNIDSKKFKEEIYSILGSVTKVLAGLGFEELMNKLGKGGSIGKAIFWGISNPQTVEITFGAFFKSIPPDLLDSGSKIWKAIGEMTNKAQEFVSTCKIGEDSIEEVLKKAGDKAKNFVSSFQSVRSILSTIGKFISDIVKAAINIKTVGFEAVKSLFKSAKDSGVDVEKEGGDNNNSPDFENVQDERAQA